MEEEEASGLAAAAPESAEINEISLMDVLEEGQERREVPLGGVGSEKEEEAMRKSSK